MKVEILISHHKINEAVSKAELQQVKLVSSGLVEHHSILNIFRKGPIRAGKPETFPRGIVWLLLNTRL